MKAPELARHEGSWVVIRRATGEAVVELFSRSLVERVDETRFEVKTIGNYLGDVNRKIREDAGASR